MMYIPFAAMLRDGSWTFGACLSAGPRHSA